MMKGERSCILNTETYNMYFDLKEFVHGYEILRGSLQIVIDHIFRESLFLNLIYKLKMPCIKGQFNVKIHKMFVIIKNGEIVSLKSYT